MVCSKKTKPNLILDYYESGKHELFVINKYVDIDVAKYREVGQIVGNKETNEWLA